jgi:hypothetical protein
MKKGGTRCPLDLAVAKNATYRFLAVFLAAFFAAFFAFLAMCYPPLQGGFEKSVVLRRDGAARENRPEGHQAAYFFFAVFLAAFLAAFFAFFAIDPPKGPDSAKWRPRTS